VPCHARHYSRSPVDGQLTGAEKLKKLNAMLKRPVGRHTGWAHTYIGLLYEIGDGVPFDCRKALAKYIEGANMGCLKGMFGAGSCYLKGLGVPRNYTKAAKWFVPSRHLLHVLSLL
jgi:hypothetical protein